MRNIVPLVSAGLTAAFLLNCNAAKQQQVPSGDVALNTGKDSVSYAIGMDIGENFKAQSVEVEMGPLMAGIRDVVEGNDTKLTDEQVGQVMMAFQKDMQKKMQSKNEAAAESNREEGEKFLAENAKKEGVKVTDSGLQYEIVEAGTGATPESGQNVSCHYRGTLIDGTEFDSSYKRGEPATFPVDGVIPGWTEALKMMKEGAKWKLFVPAKLAYGERGAGAVIGPNATLIFEVELIKVM